MGTRTTRKVQQLPGNQDNEDGDSPKGSFLVTLPKKWCINNGLESGDEVELEIDKFGKSTILIRLPGEHENEKSEIVIDYKQHAEDRSLSRTILGRYLDGYEFIKVENIPQAGEVKLKIRKLIRNLSAKLYGSWLNERGGQFELRVSAELISPRSLLDDLFSIALMMFKDAILTYLKLNSELARDIVERDDQADRLYFHMVRTLKILLQDPFYIEENKFKDFEILDILDFRMIASYFENLADTAELTAEKVLNTNKDQLEIGPKLSNDFSSIANQIAKLLKKSFECFKEHDEYEAISISNQGTSIMKELTELRRRDILPQAMFMLEEATECIIDILELVTK